MSILNTKQIEDNLPSKLSELIVLAVKNLNKVEKMPDYAIDMSTWHDKRTYLEDKCCVCFAGSVMACELNVDKELYLSPRYFNESLKWKFASLDAIRKYCIAESLAFIERANRKEHIKHNVNLENEIISKLCSLRKVSGFYQNLSSYEEDAKLFKLNMLYIAKELKKLNL